MIQPIEITVDTACPAAYVTYRMAPFDASYVLRRGPDNRVFEAEQPDFRPIGVVVDVDERDDTTGIEILNVDDPEEVAIARDYATAHDLEFPADIRAAARALT